MEIIFSEISSLEFPDGNWKFQGIPLDFQIPVLSPIRNSEFHVSARLKFYIVM
jgi:hypothetical protein